MSVHYPVVNTPWLFVPEKKPQDQVISVFHYVVFLFLA